MRKLLSLLMMMALAVGAFALPKDVDPGTNGYGYVTIVPSELSAEELFYVYSPDSGVRSSEYTYYYFPKESLEIFIAESMFASSREVPFQVFYVKMAPEIYNPQDDSLPQPEGGFLYHKYLVVPVEIAQDPAGLF
jgi:hypothetical protein